MPRIKSLLIRVEVDEAQRAHSCQANASHRFERGDRRLKVRNGRSWDHYCVVCAALMIQRAMADPAAAVFRDAATRPISQHQPGQSAYRLKARVPPYPKNHYPTCLKWRHRLGGLRRNNR